MYRITFFLILITIINFKTVSAQITNKIKTNSEEQQIRNRLKALADTSMYGRGYVKNGKEIASRFIQGKYKELNLRGITKDGSYVQSYLFPVNTFPGAMKLVINKHELTPGEDYIIEPASKSYTGQKKKIVSIDLNQVVDTATWLEIRNTLTTENVYYFENIEHLCKTLEIKKSYFPHILPQGCYLINQKEKLNWSITMDTCIATVFYVADKALPKKLKTADVDVYSSYIPKCKNENIVGFIPGKIRDTFLAFTAHYDHLGMMGNSTIYPGASDNASGTAMMLYLAYYFSMHPQKYSLLFIAFSGEEAALIGSKYFTTHPAVPLKNIKFLTNLDILGDATDGITVVNATEFPKEFQLLQKLNTRSQYIPFIKERGKAANSDHYYFTEAGVPSFFIYSNGGRGFYHDINDNSNEVTLNNIDGVAKLIIDFVKQFSW